GGCSANATCQNTAGSRTCTCNTGYTGDGVTCTDINECATNNGGCSANATCQNTAGSRTCTCNTGYTGDGVTCTDINECLTNNGGCDPNATCTNTPGSRTCTCKTGFTGNGVTCTDINECTNGTNNCDSNARCVNTPGSFNCVCDPPLAGTGLTCGCDLSGTFAVRTETDVQWDAVMLGAATLISAGNATLISWSIRHQVQTGSSLTVVTTPCGGTTPDLCSPFFNQAYSQSI